MLFFSFFAFKEKSLRMYVDSCQVSTRASTVTVCSCVSVTNVCVKRKKKAYRTFDTILRNQNNQPEDGRDKYRRSKLILIMDLKFFLSLC